MVKFIKLWLPVFAWCGLIFFLSSIPGLKTPFGVIDTVLRKCAHVTEYFVLTLLLYRAFRKSTQMPFSRLLFWSAALSFLYAASDEYHQTFVPHRSGRPLDVVIDLIGIFAAVFLYLKYRKKSYLRP